MEDLTSDICHLFKITRTFKNQFLLNIYIKVTCEYSSDKYFESVFDLNFSSYLIWFIIVKKKKKR